jgi:hypothetical protein
MDSDSKPPDLRVPNLEIFPPSRRKKPTSWNEKVTWLVVWNIVYFPIYRESSHLTNIFQRARSATKVIGG